jgi:hypothetical protein
MVESNMTSENSIRGWTWEFGTLALGLGLSLWLAWGNVAAALDSGSRDTLAYSIAADAALFFFGLAFWHFRALGKNIACAMLALFWLAAAGYVISANVAKMQGEFAAAWKPIQDAEARHSERMRRLDDDLAQARANLREAQHTALTATKTSMRDAANKIAIAAQDHITALEIERNAPAPVTDHPSVKHFLIGWEAVAPIVLLLAAQMAIWATFNSGSNPPQVITPANREPVHRGSIEPVAHGVAHPGSLGGSNVSHLEPPLNQKEKTILALDHVSHHEPLPDNVVPIRSTLDQRVVALLDQGVSQRAIARKLDIDRNTVQRIAKRQAAVVEAVKQ